MKIDLTNEEVKNILESLDLEEIMERRQGYYPQWTTTYGYTDGWELETKEKEKKNE